MSSMQQLSRGKHNKIRWILNNYAQNLCCNLWGGVKLVEGCSHIVSNLMVKIYLGIKPVSRSPTSQRATRNGMFIWMLWW